MRLSSRGETKVCFESSFVLLGLKWFRWSFFSVLLFSFFPYAVFFRWRKKIVSVYLTFKSTMAYMLEFTKRMNKMKRQNEMIVYIWNCLTWISHEKSVREEVKRFVMLLQFFNEHNRVTILNWGTIFIFPFFFCPLRYIYFIK